MGRSRGYEVRCEEEETVIFGSSFYDVAERFADRHEESTGHATEVVEVKDETP